jgi:N-acetylmuramate 1-kinase
MKDEKQNRYQQLQAWVLRVLSSSGRHSLTPDHLLPISGDAGFRQYYRVVGSKPAMLAVDAPPETEKNRAFCHIAQLFRQSGIHAPQVYAVDYNSGFMLIEDMGSDMYLPLLTREAHTNLYRDAVQCLLKMQSIPTADAGLELYDAHKLQQEMDLFPEWFVKKMLQSEMTAEITAMLKMMSRHLVDTAVAQPQVVVHRDFHCRNLMYVTNNNPGVIDFQDAVIGPVTYDLVSLYRDCYIQWPLRDVKQWVIEYRQLLLEKNIIQDVSEEKFLRWFDWMGLQRHIKVLGIFARLYLRDGKSGYLKDLPLVIHYTLSVAKQYPEFSGFVVWFEQELLPRARQCEWYREL